MRLFIKMRQMLSTNQELLLKLEQIERKLEKHDKEIEEVFAHLKQLIIQESIPRVPVGFKISTNK